MAASRFGACVTECKVTPTREKNHPAIRFPAFKTHAVTINNPDYTNIDQVGAVVTKIRELGVTEKLSYKPDIYTVVGIFRGNSLGIKPSINTSTT